MLRQATTVFVGSEEMPRSPSRSSFGAPAAGAPPPPQKEAGVDEDDEVSSGWHRTEAASADGRMLETWAHPALTFTDGSSSCEVFLRNSGLQQTARTIHVRSCTTPVTPKFSFERILASTRGSCVKVQFKFAHFEIARCNTESRLTSCRQALTSLVPPRCQSRARRTAVPPPGRHKTSASRWSGRGRPGPSQRSVAPSTAPGSGLLRCTARHGGPGTRARTPSWCAPTGNRWLAAACTSIFSEAKRNQGDGVQPNIPPPKKPRQR